MLGWQKGAPCFLPRLILWHGVTENPRKQERKHTHTHTHRSGQRKITPTDTGLPDTRLSLLTGQIFSFIKHIQKRLPCTLSGPRSHFSEAAKLYRLIIRTLEARLCVSRSPNKRSLLTRCSGWRRFSLKAACVYMLIPQRCQTLHSDWSKPSFTGL